ncbi:hypothetical protein [Thomasclavelia sp.]|nr:hypothetical protein [Thomasclavelia sp.]
MQKRVYCPFLCNIFRVVLERLKEVNVSNYVEFFTEIFIGMMK